MKVKILFSYTEFIIPKGCRKARYVSFDDGEVAISVKEIRPTDAPVAIRATGGFDDETPYTTEYRWWKGRLWTSLRVSSGRPCSHTSRGNDWAYAPLPLNEVIDLRSGKRLHNPSISLSSSRRCTKTQAIADMREQMGNIILIGGVTYCVASEPCYKVMTFGMGWNHGGTALMLDIVSGVKPKNRFGLLDLEAAIEDATETAADRGDSQSLPIVPHGPRFEVLIPEAIKLRCKQPRPCMARPKVLLGISASGVGAYF